MRVRREKIDFFLKKMLAACSLSPSHSHLSASNPESGPTRSPKPISYPRPSRLAKASFPLPSRPRWKQSTPTSRRAPPPPSSGRARLDAGRGTRARARAATTSRRRRTWISTPTRSAPRYVRAPIYSPLTASPPRAHALLARLRVDWVRVAAVRMGTDAGSR
jgi:hypothetical protein